MEERKAAFYQTEDVILRDNNVQFWGEKKKTVKQIKNLLLINLLMVAPDGRNKMLELQAAGP